MAGVLEVATPATAGELRVSSERWKQILEASNGGINAVAFYGNVLASG
jgi:hypothetical protein